MRWPFVSRARLDAKEAERALWERSSRAGAEIMDVTLKAERARFDTLLEKYHAIVAPKPEPAAPTFSTFPPVVASALAQACAGAPQDVARAVYRKARALLDAGGNEADVAAHVLRGERAEVAD